jgi:hypothetical protein
LICFTFGCYLKFFCPRLFLQNLALLISKFYADATLGTTHREKANTEV